MFHVVTSFAIRRQNYFRNRFRDIRKQILTVRIDEHRKIRSWATLHNFGFNFLMLTSASGIICILCKTAEAIQDVCPSTAGQGCCRPKRDRCQTSQFDDFRTRWGTPRYVTTENSPPSDVMRNFSLDWLPYSDVISHCCLFACCIT